MGKKLLNSSILYFIGMALVVVGLICPLTKNSSCALKYLNFKNFGWSSIGILLILIGAVCGILLSILAKGNRSNKFIALLVSLAGGVVITLLLTGTLSDNGVASFVWRTLGKGIVKHAYIGFYLILSGWVLSIAGWVTDK